MRRTPRNERKSFSEKMEEDSDLAADAHTRRYTAKYRRKKRLVRDVWICSGLIIVFMPLHLQMTLLLLTMFLSFCILDETP